jgi:hypothetical protein
LTTRASSTRRSGSIGPAIVRPRTPRTAARARRAAAPSSHHTSVSYVASRFPK